MEEKERKRSINLISVKVKEKIKKNIHNYNKYVVTHDKGILIDKITL